MTIVIVANRDFRFQTTHPLDLARVFTDEGEHVYVLSLAPEDIVQLYKNDGFTMISLQSGGHFSKIMEIYRHIRRIRPDIVIGYEQVGYAYSFCSLKWWSAGCKLIYYANELSRLSEGERGFATHFQQWFARYADFVITGGVHRAEIMKTDWHLDTFPYVLTNTLVRPPRGHNDLLFRKSSILKENDVTVLYATSLDDCTCIMELIRSTQFWNENVKLILCGYGEESYIDSVQQEIISLGVSHKVEYIGMFSNKREVFKLIEQCDIGIVLRNHRGYTISNVVYYTPGKLMEYAAFGIPCICSDNVTLLPYAEEGWVICVDPTDIRMIAEKINLLSSNTILRREMADKASCFFEHRYCMEVEGRKLLTSIKEQLFES